MAKNFKAWPEGWPRSLNYPELPIYEILEQTAARVPNRICIIFGGMELTFSELKELSERFATALAEMGVQKGDRVAIHLLNCPQFAIAYYGVMRLGAIFTPLSPLLSPREALHQLNDAGAETLITLDLLHPGIKDIIPETGVKRVISTSIADCYNPVIAPVKPLGKIEAPDTIDFASLLKEHEPNPPQVSIDVKKDLAHLAYTGGTTGASKGVMVTHYNVMVNTLQYANWSSGTQIEMVDGVLTPVYPAGVDPLKDRITARDRETSLVVAPWFHAMGTVGYLNAQICGGNTMVVLPRFDPRDYMENLVKYRVTMLGGAPQLFIPLFQLPDFESYDLSSVKAVGSGAAPLPLSVLHKLREAFSEASVGEAYGLTEVTMGSTGGLPDGRITKPGSVGLPIYDTEMKAVDPETGEDLPIGEEGEILIRGPQLMQGYWNKPEETAKVIKDGWFYSGDIGKEDEDGFFFITGRKKDMIIYKGYNVYPREIEEVIFKHPAVEQCSVVGKEDTEGGEIPVAFVVLKEGAQARADEIMEHANSEIAHYKKVREVVFIDAIPLSGVGKVLKRDLREKLKQE